MRDTPRTDALVQIIDGGSEYAPLPEVLAHARQLERELAKAAMQNFDHETAIAMLERELNDLKGIMGQSECIAVGIGRGYTNSTDYDRVHGTLRTTACWNEMACTLHKCRELGCAVMRCPPTR